MEDKMIVILSSLLVAAFSVVLFLLYLVFFAK